jgi:lipopolysaccharide/colanic/teichoic acid biosynthesis glycosyltransferase
VDEVRQYGRRHRRRISIKPGITGMWQVSGRSEIVDFEQVVALDTRYIDEWSLLLDFKLMLKTVAVVLARNGAH